MRPTKPLLRVLAGEKLDIPPIWIMRQAGRYLPEYRELRAKTRPSWSSATRPAWRPKRRCSRSGASASMRRSCSATFSSFPMRSARRSASPRARGRGFRRSPSLEGLSQAARGDRPRASRPVFEAIGRVKEGLPAETTLLGFCGAPWTVASYMIAGKGTPELAPSRLVAYRDPDFMQALIDRLVVGVHRLPRPAVRSRCRCGADLRELRRRADAGRFRALVADADPADHRGGPREGAGREDHRVRPPSGLGKPGVPETGADAIGAGLGASTAHGRRAKSRRSAPCRATSIRCSVVAGGDVGWTAASMPCWPSSRAGRISSTSGHGIVPETPPENVAQLVKRIRGA